MSGVDSRIGIVFDVDGVLLRGGSLLPSAKEALQSVVDARIPHVFVTNGGGWKESVKAELLSKDFGISVNVSQVIACHTPFKALASTLGDRPVMVIGRENCREVAESYGFRKVVTPQDVQRVRPNTVPIQVGTVHCSSNTTTGLSCLETVDSMLSNIAAVFIFHDPVNWTADIQIALDALCDWETDPESSTPQLRANQRVPLYASNADIIYAADHDRPRLTQGAFVAALEAVATHQYHLNLKVNWVGKPYPTTYKFAEDVLLKQLQELHNSESVKFTTLYGIGDNPASDIRGANAAGDHWKSILVGTGLFDISRGNDANDPADYVFPSVREAVSFIVANNTQ